MLYSELLKQDRPCPFCDCQDRILAEHGSAYLTYARAPYHRHHLLALPKRHVTSVLELSAAERADVFVMECLAARALERLGYSDYSLLARSGVATGRTVAHLHFHIVPAARLGDLDHAGKPRMVLEESEVTAVARELSRAIDGGPRGIVPHFENGDASVRASS